MAAVAAIFFAVTAFGATYNYSFPVAGLYQISLPSVINSPSIISAEDLFAAIPNAERVEIFDPNGAFRAYDGFCENDDPGAMAECGSTCFCIDPTEGLGVRVFVVAPSMFDITGCDNQPLEIRMTNSALLISLPFTSNLPDAQALLDDMNLMAAEQGVIFSSSLTVSTPTDFFGDGSNGVNFPIVPGEGYIVGAPVSDLSPVTEWIYRPFATVRDDPACPINCGNSSFPVCDGDCPLGQVCDIDDGICACFGDLQGACCVDSASCEHTTAAQCSSSGGVFRGLGVECDSSDPLFCEPLLVTLESAEATVVRGGVQVNWTTAVEIDTVGFRLLRQDRGSREKSLKVVATIPAAGNGLEGSSYDYLDLSEGAQDAVFYFLEDVDIFGRSTRHDPIRVQNPGRQSPRGRESISTR